MKKQMIRADFAIHQDSEQIIQVGRSTIYVPEIHTDGYGIHWLDESVYMENNKKKPGVKNENDNSNNP